MNKVIENDVEKTKDEIVNEVKTRVESLWENGIKAQSN